MPNPSSTSSPGPLPEEIRNLLAGKEREGGGDTGGGGAGRRAGRDRSAQPSPSAARGGGPSRGIAVPVPGCGTGREWACMPKCTDLPFRAGELRVS